MNSETGDMEPVSFMEMLFCLEADITNYAFEIVHISDKKKVAVRPSLYLIDHTVFRCYILHRVGCGPLLDQKTTASASGDHM